MPDWIAGAMIQRYVEERFSTYTQLMDVALDTREDLTQDERILAKFSNFIAFSNNITTEVDNVFKVKVSVEKIEYKDYNNLYSTVFEIHILYEGVSAGKFGFSIEMDLLKKYQEGYNYGKLN